MNLLRKIIAPFLPAKSASASAAAPMAASGGGAPLRIDWREELASPVTAERNFMSLFMSVPEVFFPIDFIASRIAKAHFEIRRSKDDSIVWCNRRMGRILDRPNCIMGWSELIYTHFVYKLATGNAYMRAAMPEALHTPSSVLYRMCDHFWPLPATDVKAVPRYTRSIPLFGVCETEDLISGYTLGVSGQTPIGIPAWQVWHDRDGKACTDASGCRFLKSESRLLSVMKPISNLIAVYMARNVIYAKRGGIGFLVSLKRDETGSTAMTPDEKKEINEYLTETYGIGEGQVPIGITDVPLSFVRTNLSIQELQPFEETLEDAVKIAGAFGIPDVLVPRKDHSTFSNQSTAEKSAYSGVIIPMARQFCRDLTCFLGLDRDGLYLDCNFSDVDCMQVGLRDAEEVKGMVNERCRSQFADGLITLNDWRAQIHESAVDEDEYPFFGKLKFDMTDEELALVARVQGNGMQSVNKPSTGDSDHEREDEMPDVADEGE